MEVVPYYLVPAAIIGVIVWLVARGVIKVQRDTTSAKDFARARGWNFSANDGMYGSHWAWGPFAESGEGRASNVIRGEMECVDVSGKPIERPIHSLNYRVTDIIYIDEQTQNSIDSDFHIVAMGVPFTLPEIHLAPENMLSRKFSRDIAFGDPEFDNKWQVNGNDEQAIRQILDIRVRKYLMDPRHKGMRYTFIDGYLFVWTKGAQKLPNIDPMLENANALINLMPRF